LIASAQFRFPLSLAMRQGRLRTVLEKLLEPFNLTWVPHHEAVFITTRDAANDMMEIKVYPIDDVVRSTHLAGARSLASALTAAVRPNSWDALGGPAVASPAPGVLVVAQSHEAHDAIERWLAGRRVRIPRTRK
jgi:hypothetical protein